jgi:hypothetical protein
MEDHTEYGQWSTVYGRRYGQIQIKEQRYHDHYFRQFPEVLLYFGIGD